MNDVANQLTPAHPVDLTTAGPSAAIGDDWYLQAYRSAWSAEANTFGRRWMALRLRWDKRWSVAAALLFGLSSGLVFASLRHPPVELAASARASSRTPPVSAAPPVQLPSPRKTAAPSSAVSPDELSRLRARNRRLEALIQVLRQRKEERKAVEPATYLGQ